MYVTDAPMVLKDRYGFFVTDDFHKVSSLSPALLAQRQEKEQTRTRKWLAMKKHWKRHFFYKRNAPTESNGTVVVVSATETTQSATLSEADEVELMMRQTIQTLTDESILRDHRESRPVYSAVLKRRVRKGIPDALREFAWFEFSDAQRVRQMYPHPDTDIDLSNIPHQVQIFCPSFSFCSSQFVVQFVFN